MQKDTDYLIKEIRSIFKSDDFIPLHAPYFGGNEKKYLNECIDSTFVSSVGEFVTKFEEEIAKYTGAKYAVACVNGTNALHLALHANNVKPGDEVITQALTFIATANAIKYSGANPIFIDVEKEQLGISPIALEKFLKENTEKTNKGIINKNTGNRIAAVMPMHTFGIPSKIDEIAKICSNWNLPLIEDSAESLGTIYKGKHTGTYGNAGIFSFNGNKTITSGGGGIIITDDEEIAKKTKHLSTQAKVPHAWEFRHDEIGYNYRMPNLNAALALAQLEQLEEIIENKRDLHKKYQDVFNDSEVQLINEPEEARSNYWLNAVIVENKEERDRFLKQTNEKGVMTRPIWELMSTLPMFKDCESDGLQNSQWLADRVINIPSSFRK